MFGRCCAHWPGHGVTRPGSLQRIPPQPQLNCSTFQHFNLLWMWGYCIDVFHLLLMSYNAMRHPLNWSVATQDPGATADWPAAGGQGQCWAAVSRCQTCQPCLAMFGIEWRLSNLQHNNGQWTVWLANILKIVNQRRSLETIMTTHRKQLL